MPAITDEILKGIADHKPISEELHDTDAVAELLDNYKNYRNLYDASLPEITEESLGREFKEAIKLLPANKKLRFLSIYSDSLSSVFDKQNSFNNNFNNRTNFNNSENNTSEFISSELPDTKLYNDYMFKILIFSFLGIVLLVLAMVTFISMSGNELPGNDLFSSIFSNLVEIIRIIAGAK